MSTAFYCASSDVYFPGAVALVNSLRLHGHDEPIYLLDCGLSAPHRELLAREVTIVDEPAGTMPHLQKTVAPRRHPAETMVLIDADMIVTRPLTELVERAAGGAVLAVENDMQRFVPEWGELLGIGPLTERRYVSSGLVALGGEVGGEVLPLWGELSERVDFQRSCFADADPDYEFLFIDQDVLNAILCVPRIAERTTSLPQDAAPVPPFAGISITDLAGVRCAGRDGSSPYVLHHFARKPWLVRLRANVYSRLLTRLLLADDVPLRVDPAELPARLRRGVAGTGARLWADAVMTGPGIARRLRRDPAPVRVRAGWEPE